MSTIKEIKYDTDDQTKFEHNIDEIDFIQIIEPPRDYATLVKIPKADNELSTFTGQVQQDADRKTGSGELTLNGGATITQDTPSDPKYYNVEDSAAGVNARVQDPADFGFGGGDVGSGGLGKKLTYSKKIIFPYTGSPTFNNYLISFGNDSIAGNLAYAIEITHSTIGTFQCVLRNSTGGIAGNSSMGSFSAVSGQEYDFLLTYDEDTSQLKLYLDGIIKGTLTLGATVKEIRNVCYIGSVANGTGQSSFKFRDVQFFNDVLYTANFDSEIPRVISLLPLNSRIIPKELSYSEGIFSVDHIATTPGDSVVKYQLYADYKYYWINGGAVEEASGLENANTKEEWTTNAATVTTFIQSISSRVSIVMVPVLGSGALGINNPELESTSLEYDFAPPASTCDVCIVYGNIKGDCAPPTWAEGRFYTKKPIDSQGNKISLDVPIVVSLTTGQWEIEAPIPNLPESTDLVKDYYYYDLKWIDSDGKYWEDIGVKVLVPNAGSASAQDIRVNERG